MNFNYKLTYEEVRKLKCVQCHNYLCHFPIHTSSNGQSICGRCPRPKEGYVKNEIYEILSQNVVFPCRYEGCWETLPAKDIPQHEEQCPYRYCGCITKNFTGCTEKVCHLDMVQHCQEKHSGYFLKCAEFEIDIKKSQKCNNLIEHEKELLIFSTEFDHDKKWFKFMLSANIYYELEFACTTRSFSVNCNNTGATNIHKIFLESLIDPEESKMSAKIYLEPQVSSLTRKDVQKELANLWKCSSCSGYVLPLTSINTTICPKCENSIYASSTSIYTRIEKIANLTSFHCENFNKGCNFVGQGPQLEKHQDFCQFVSHACPVEEFVTCTWDGLKKESGVHLLTDHKAMFIDSSSPAQVISISTTSLTKCYILNYSFYYFKLISIQRGYKLYWIMQMIGEFKNLFRYEIDICDASKTCFQTMIITQACSQDSSIQELEKNLGNYYYLSSNQIEAYKTLGGTITFKVRIFKNNC